jgi:RNA polymerase sigma-70 factor (sigma-E family)
MSQYWALEADHTGAVGGSDDAGNAENAGNAGHTLMVTPVPRSFELAFGDLYRLAYRVAFRILGDRADAEDVAQEALARATLRWAKLHERPEGWVSTVASNLAVDRYRRRRREPTIPTGPIGVVDDQTVERGDLVAALRKLPRRQREVVVLRYLADLSEADVAATLGCSVGSVKTHASRGLAAMRRQLGDATTNGDDVRAS